MQNIYLVKKNYANPLEGDTKPPEGDNSMKFVYHQLNIFRQSRPEYGTWALLVFLDYPTPDWDDWLFEWETEWLKGRDSVFLADLTELNWVVDWEL